MFEDGAVVDAKALCEAGLVKKACDGIKVLSNGTLTKKLTVQVAAFSEVVSYTHLATTYGRIGVKVWIYKGEVLHQAAAKPSRREGGKQ